MKLNYGILSTASITERFIKGVQLSQNGCVLAVASRDIEKALVMTEKYNIVKAYGDYVDLCLDPEIDIIYIATPNHLHFEHMKMALSHDKHVVCEKPFVLHEEEAKEIFKLAKEKKRFVMEAQKSIFMPAIEFVREQLHNQTIGDIWFISLTSSFKEGSDKSNWMYDNKKGGGVLYGSASYTIELMQYLLDTNFQSVTHITSQINEVDEVASFMIKHGSCIINSTISRKVDLPHQAILYGTKGTITIPSYWRANQVCLTENGLTQQFDFPYDSEFVYEVDHINTCILEHKLESDRMTMERTLSCVRLVEEMKHSN